ncbi:cytochrome o ubiquinol oxidase subunit IV [Bartonella vinsonii]|uniref:cytochrome o ubiquinol oxidase subunit IV n=1 Tax=Bartonella vinsonii TaxID=33047 RepID=UPI0002B6BFF6|nr:cytochrome o ubiquinol oxidase subunit IV [Bartonella vinsonii]AGF75270.1 cytochrome o ubiquinol oxidase subunit IV [Bartonella vinsonii subsp. berkhoffii str. Winnie]
MSRHNEAHGSSTGSYLIGFILAVFFTMGSFIPVMYGMMDSWAISTKVAYLIGMAIIQIIVQIVFFLHLNSGPDAKWNLSALWFAAICVFIIIGGTWWAISHLNYNMMGGSGRVIEPEVLGSSVSAPKQLPNTEKSVEQLSIQAPVEQAPGAEMPVGQSTQAPVEQAPNVEMPVGQSIQAPVEQAPGMEMPVGQSTQAPVEQAPNVEMSVGQSTQAPIEQAPNVEMPVGQSTQAPIEQAPGVEMPVGQSTQAPGEQASGVEMPVGQAPNTQNSVK